MLNDAISTEFFNPTESEGVMYSDPPAAPSWTYANGDGLTNSDANINDPGAGMGPLTAGSGYQLPYGFQAQGAALTGPRSGPLGRFAAVTVTGQVQNSDGSTTTTYSDGSTITTSSTGLIMAQTPATGFLSSLTSGTVTLPIVGAIPTWMALLAGYVILRKVL